MVRQKEVRCGKVIWTITIQLIYLAVYYALIMDRYPIYKIYEQNLDMDEIIW